jgi:hypothetical protein
MKKFLLVFVAVNCMFFSCNKNKVSTVPACILQRIEQIRKQPVWNPAAEVNQYTYNGKTVYSISADCCDQYTILVDENCQTICAPGGGITGRGDGKCADFSEKAKFVQLVWKDERTK